MSNVVSAPIILGAAAFLSIFLAGCQSSGPSAVVPATGAGITEPGTFTRIKNHNPDKWTGTNLGGDKWRLVCKPLACAEPSIILIQRGRSPTRDPDPTALKKLAEVAMPAALAANDMTASAASSGHVHFKMEKSVVSNVRGFPAVTVDFARTGVGAPDHGVRIFLFAGNAMLSVMSVSKSKAVAQRNLDEYIAALDIIDMPSQPVEKVGLSSPPAPAAEEKK